ncbi:uncharacterized protein [Choristoneura fumiferana]|uniref:uncharacterized protein n=1 Tax=Choristoneura fumiferana TaxID=7141 RepID=UPI003D1560FF
MVVSYYILTQRPAVTYFNKTYIAYIKVSSQRHGRSNPLYYVDIHYKSVVPFDNEFKVDFYFFELLSNEYRRGFVEMHFKWCDLIHKNPFFGAPMRQGKLLKPCPYPPDVYDMYNMTIPSLAIPPGFPFTKGRIFANVSHHGNAVYCGHMDMELKEKIVKPEKV